MTNFSARERSAITSLRSNGTSVKSIATAFGCNVGVIYSATKGVSTTRTLSSSVSKPKQAASLRPANPAPSSLTSKKRASRASKQAGSSIGYN